MMAEGLGLENPTQPPKANSRPLEPQLSGTSKLTTVKVRSQTNVVTSRKSFWNLAILGRILWFRAPDSDEAQRQKTNRACARNMIL